MKKLSTLLISLCVFVFFSCNSSPEKNDTKGSITDTLKTKSNPVENRTNIKEAFDQGKLELKFEALENGKFLEVTALNLTTDPLSLFISVGTTAFTENISIITTEIQNLDIPANEKIKFKVDQKAGGMIGGSMTVRKQPHK